MNAKLVLPLLVTVAALAATGAAAAGPAPAGAPDTAAMIEALQPATGGVTRNLVVRQTAQGAVGAPPEAAAAVGAPPPRRSRGVLVEPK